MMVSNQLEQGSGTDMLWKVVVGTCSVTHEHDLEIDHDMRIQRDVDEILVTSYERG
jgi:hypothetical protein